MPDLNTLIQQITQIRSVRAFPKYIEYIKFPYFRNLEIDTKIDFDFPFTVFVGQNGSGKSSTLQALYGAPRGKSVGDYWFSTKVDPIEENTDAERNRLIYAFRRNNKLVDVLKQRSPRKNKPEYWETARPQQGLQMLSQNREAPIDMEVVYLDFRAELSAFDKYFYFKDETKLTSNTKQDYLRKKSVRLKEIIDTNAIYRFRGYKHNERPINLTPRELTEISKILGKEYISGKIILHKLFENWGYTVLYSTKFYSYSEAFAGSGEMAVVRLVHEVLKASDNCLVLLDEPEVSLHPGAQEALKLFLLEQIRRKKLQVVISTHSPSLVDGLPSNAIKVFTQLPSGKFQVENERTSSEAFFFLGMNLNNQRRVIVVEDELSKSIIEAVLLKMGNAVSSQFVIEYFPGGHTVIKNSFATVYSQEPNSHKYIIFDGDQKRVQHHFDPNVILPINQTEARFQSEIVAQTGMSIQFNTDGNQQGGNAIQKVELMKRYLEYYNANVFYLPQNTPEDIIWNEVIARGLLSSISVPQNEIDTLINTGNSKVKFYNLALKLTGQSSDISTFYKTFLNNWLNQNNQDYQDIVSIINVLRAKR